GVALILIARICPDGSLLDGRIVSAVQRRPGGPYPDSGMRAFREIMRLSKLDFPDGGIEFHDDGSFTPKKTND
ncbi:MAG: hypothetical protein IH809_03150, partial [Proteobacteria bacterium]|nr:hypothetical protein [Pseudomonadota bacterium]